MAIYIKHNGKPERLGVIAVKHDGKLERLVSVWVKTSAGLVKIYESVRSCFAGKTWRYNRPWLFKDKWKY